MKLREGFVSNSSSSSFVIKKYELSQRQIDQIVNHKEVSQTFVKPDDWEDEYGIWDERYIFCQDGEEWGIEIQPEHIYGYTAMDNFDMSRFLEHIGINETHIEWGDYYGAWEPGGYCDEN